MKKEIKIEVPKNYSAVSFKKYLNIQKDLADYKDDEQAQDAFLLYNLCGITPEIARKLDNKTVNKVKTDLYELLNNQDYELQKKITINDVEYGFEPNLAEMSYGAYLDVCKHEELALDKNWPNVLSILYRPITKTSGALYEIKPYDSSDVLDPKEWLDVNMDFMFGCFFFFNRIYLDCLKDTLKSLTEETLTQTQVGPHIKQALLESGKLINLLSSSPKMTFLSSRK